MRRLAAQAAPPSLHEPRTSPTQPCHEAMFKKSCGPLFACLAPLLPICLWLGMLGAAGTLVGAGVALLLSLVLLCLDRLPQSSGFVQSRLKGALLLLALLTIHHLQNVSPLEVLVEEVLAVVIAFMALMVWLHSCLPPESSSVPAQRSLEKAPANDDKLVLTQSLFLMLQVAVFLNAAHLILTALCPSSPLAFWLFLPDALAWDAFTPRMVLGCTLGWTCLIGAALLLACLVQTCGTLVRLLRRHSLLSLLKGELLSLLGSRATPWLMLIGSVAVSILLVGTSVQVRCSKELRVVTPLGAGTDLVRPSTTDLPPCDPLPDTEHASELTSVQTWAELRTRLQALKARKDRAPPCEAVQRVAVVLPVAKQRRHLPALLGKLHALFARQGLNGTFLVVRQWNEEVPFNTGKLKNVGFLEAMKLGNFDCVIFHDVDVYPENLENPHLCDRGPRHLSPALDRRRYVLPYARHLGGVLALTPDVVVAVNGFSNAYMHSALTMDDMSARLEEMGMVVSQPPAHVGRYHFLKCKERQKPETELRLLRMWRRRWWTDGLGLNYTVLSANSLLTHTHIYVKLGSTPSLLQQRMHHSGPDVDLRDFYQCRTWT